MQLCIRGVDLSFAQPDGSRQTVLAVPEFRVESGARIAVAGPSGAGKTSLLYVLAGILLPESGDVTWGDTTITSLSEANRDRWRLDTAGFVFQEFLLFPGMTATQNVMLASTFGGAPEPRHGSAVSSRSRAVDLLRRVGIAESGRSVDTLSRGERQRVALARALFGEPAVLFADEPTASLDRDSAREVADLLASVAAESGTTLIAVSHDTELQARMDATYRLESGRLAVVEGP